jgi:hypothetical protein
MANGNINVILNLIMRFMALFVPLSVHRNGAYVSAILYSVLKPGDLSSPQIRSEADSEFTSCSMLL